MYRCGSLLGVGLCKRWALTRGRPLLEVGPGGSLIEAGPCWRLEVGLC